MWFKKKPAEPETGVCAKCHGVFLKIYMKKVIREDGTDTTYLFHGLPGIPSNERLYCPEHSPAWDKERVNYNGSISYYKRIPEHWELVTPKIEQHFD